MRNLLKVVLFASVVFLAHPVLSIAGVDAELKNNLSKTNCIKSWKYNKSVFKLHLNPENCKENEAVAVLLAIRSIFELNNAEFPKNIEIHYGNSPKPDLYPFSRIPSLVNN